MRINISTESGILKLQNQLNLVQENCKVRIVTAEQVSEAAVKIIEELQITKKALNGCKVNLDLNAKNMLSIYDSQPQSTIVSMEFSNGKWFVTDVRRDYIRRAGHNVEMIFTEEAKQAIVERFSHFAINE